MTINLQVMSFVKDKRIIKPKKRKKHPEFESINEVIKYIYDNIEIDENNCYNYKGSLTSNDYGRLTFKNKVWRVHRFIFIYYIGVIPLHHQFVCHNCDNPSCCNIEHLYLGDVKSNTEDITRRHPGFQRYKRV